MATLFFSMLSINVGFVIGCWWASRKLIPGETVEVRRRDLL